MKVIQDLLKQLTGTATADAVIEIMLKNVEGFRNSRSCYLSALDQLRADIGEPIDRIDATIHRRFTASLLFSAYLGLQMNLEHFRNSMIPNCTWPHLDYNSYLREDLSQSLPEYVKADQFLTDFRHSLTENQKALYDEKLMDYDSYLATYGPKIAHYYGYLLGNSLLHWVIPGYRADGALTCTYNMMLSNYFEKAFLPTEF